MQLLLINKIAEFKEGAIYGLAISTLVVVTILLVKRFKKAKN